MLGLDGSGFLSAFFTLVGSHGAHVTFGLIWIGVMIAQIIIKGLTTPVRSRVMRLSIFILSVMVSIDCTVPTTLDMLKRTGAGPNWDASTLSSFANSFRSPDSHDCTVTRH